MKKTMTGVNLFAVCLILGAVNGAFAEDAIKLNSSDGSTKFVLQDNTATPVFSADSNGNAYMVGYSSAAKFYGDGSGLTGVSTHTFKIGDSYGGGIIFWVDATGTQVLIAATADQSTGVKWSNNSNATGAIFDGIYAGKTNTVIISTMQHAGSYAAQVCADYNVTVNGEYYDDWYLPSKAELGLLYTQRTAVGMPSSHLYWSSNEYGTTGSNAWSVNFNGGNLGYSGRAGSYYVRCVRGGPSSSIGNLPNFAESVTDGAYRTSTQTFTGSNTFKEVTASSATITGEARLSRAPVAAADAGITLTAADYGKTITVNSAAARTVTLPAVTAADIGATVTVVKLGGGTVTVQAAASTYIEDSTAGGAIYNNAAYPAYASLTLRLVTATQWMLVGGRGAWITK
ncbi:MAG: DUF1566 domain-containing protein [Elusimicrobia bacterium]|nr:DUF1566 domain-containing protein [Elusimicrobiota bacterium]